MYLSFFIFLLNIPFGYLRSKVEKFSFKWFLYVHLPVPIIVITRLYFGIKLTIPLFAIFVFSYFSGQYVGALLNKAR